MHGSKIKGSNSDEGGGFSDGGRAPAHPQSVPPPARPAVRGPILGALGLLAALALVLGVSACGSSGSKKSTALVIGGWGGVIDEATQKSYLNEFDAANHIKSSFVDAPGEQLARVEAQNMAGKVEWDDVDSLDAGSAYTLYAKGQLLTLPAATEEAFKRELGAAKVTPFGFSHGSLGDVIVCNMAKMTTCPTTMAQFYDTKLFPQSRMFGAIEPIEASTTAEVAAGMPITQTATTPLNVPAVIKTLEGLKPKIKAFWQSGEQQQQIMRSGGAEMGIMWSDRAYQLIAQGMHLKINWLDGAYEPSYWAVLKGAPNTQEGLEAALLDREPPPRRGDLGEHRPRLGPQPGRARLSVQADRPGAR